MQMQSACTRSTCKYVCRLIIEFYKYIYERITFRTNNSANTEDSIIDNNESLDFQAFKQANVFLKKKLKIKQDEKKYTEKKFFLSNNHLLDNNYLFKPSNYSIIIWFK